MMLERHISNRWIQAGIVISQNKDAMVLCPKCQKQNLKVWDVKSNFNSNDIERHMICENCQAYNALRIKKK
ncbi:hypothetical protein [Bartonella sp. HY038]|uniref:hypothetical protein n=1 Tax=Bartonella sp. HY038 TaxID=2759660 RepID=UPI0015F891D0|nr:hypothetical protein [Bartonella sp. HY038]